jgi:hypothetical protein
MKRRTKKLTLAKETLRSLKTESLKNVFGAASEKTVCATYCITNCPTCETQRRNSACMTC